MAQAWRRAWDRVVPFFAFAPQVRKLIYTTNAIESLHSQLRKIIRTRGHFPSDEAATKLMWLALRNIMVDSGRSVREWRQAMNQFAIAFGDRFTRYVVGPAKSNPSVSNLTCGQFRTIGPAYASRQP